MTLTTTDEGYQIYVNTGDIITGVQWANGTTAERAAKKTELIALSQPAGSFDFFDKEENSKYSWNGSDWA